MQTVILAAGKGVRMRPLTNEQPKPLIEVLGKPILERNLEQMRGLIEEAVIVVGYKKEMIKERFGGSYGGLKLKYVTQEEQLGTGHALLQAEREIKGKFLVLNGDDLYSREDIQRVIRHKDNCILLQKKKEKEGLGGFGVVVVKGERVVDIVEKPKEFVSDLVNTGMFCFDLEVFGVLKRVKKSERGEYEVTEAVKELARQGKMGYEEVKGYWIPVGYPEHIREAEEFLKERGREKGRRISEGDR